MAGIELFLSPITLILQQVFNNLGQMAIGGSATIYAAGSTSLATTYTDSTGLVENPNPITLNAAGRIASKSGAPVAVWAQAAHVLKLVVSDAQGNQLIYLDQIQNINDLPSGSSLQSMLASPASSNPSGFGPVAGADLVANAVKSYDVFSDVRAANVPELEPQQTLIVISQGAVTVGDGLGGLFYWQAGSTATDDGATVLKPNSTTGPGRYLRVVLPTSSVGSNAGTFTGTLTDGVNSATGTITYASDGEYVTLRGGITMTSGATGMTMTGLPAALWPAQSQVLPTFVEDSGHANLFGAVTIGASGTLTFGVGGTAAVSGSLSRATRDLRTQAPRASTTGRSPTR